MVMINLLTVFVLVSFINLSVEKTKSNEKLENFIQEATKEIKDLPYKCKDVIDISYYIWLKKHKSKDTALYCIYKKIISSTVTTCDKRFLWVLLYEIYQEKNVAKKSAFALKQARSKEKFELTSTWYFLGPFQIGKPELDGNPMYSQGEEYLIDNRWNIKTKAYSELSPSGELKWAKLQSQPDGLIRLSPAVNWNELIQSLQSMAVTEWQGVLINDFYVSEQKTTVKVQCLGVNVFYVDDQIITGDIYHRNQYWYPLMLNAGIHMIKVPVRVNGQSAIKCQIQRNNIPKLHFHNVGFVPDLVDGNLFSYHISLVLTNMSPDKDVKVIDLSLKKHNLDFDLETKLDKEFVFKSGQVSTLNLVIRSKSTEIYSKCHRQSYTASLSLATDEEEILDFTLNLRCRKSSQSFLFTFSDHDGSVQHAAAVKPLTPCVLDVCPVLLSLHGTGVKAQDQADSYKRKKGNDFLFGVEKLWLLAPTRHGAHNWEGPGELTAMTALKRLSELTKLHDWIAKPADPDVVVFAGHSMGGHGAWQVSLHHPDKALAVISAAGWLSKEHYGDSNLFYHYDVSVSHTEPIIKAIQESCISENDADKHATNLKGIPVMIRVGANDRTVHPYFSRKMYRLLKENQVNVSYYEMPGKEHWWWDTKTENDGGVTNDVQMRTFATYAVEEYERKIVSGCTKETCSTDDSKTKYYRKQQNNRMEGNYEFILYNPASFEGGRGVLVTQQMIPFRKSSYEIRISEESVDIQTTNIKCLKLYEPKIDPVGWLRKTITIDKQEIFVGESLMYCLNGKVWANDTFVVRDRQTYGPARRIAEKPFSIGICKAGLTSSEELLLLNSATLLANLFHLTSDAHAQIIAIDDKSSILGNNNIILFGTEKCLSTLEIDQKISMEKGVTKLAYDAITIHQNLLTLALPTIPPMVRSPFSNLVPDYIVTSSAVHSKGPGGYLCTGFWDNNWNYDARASSCFCDVS